MPAFPKTRIAVGHGADPDQWYLPGTDITRLPSPVPGTPAAAAFSFYSETDRGWNGWSAGPWWRGVMTASSGEQMGLDGQREFFQTFQATRGWNSVKNLSLRSDGDTAATFDDFVHVDVDVSGHDTGFSDPGRLGSRISIDGAKRGNVITGEDDDSVWIRPFSNGGGWGNEFRVATGDGSDTIEIHTLRYYPHPPFQGRPLIEDGSATTVHIDAGRGNDIIRLGNAREIVDGGAGSRDTVIYTGTSKGVVAYLNEPGALAPLAGQGGAAGDILINVERLKGSSFDDVLHGNSGDNDLISGLGDDIMTGGAGHDHFILDIGWGDDVVTDFKVGEDVVEIRNVNQYYVDHFLRQEVTSRDGVEGLLVHLPRWANHDVTSIFLVGVTAELTTGGHGIGEPNLHYGIMLS
ncbi:hypothetical protein [Skermanella pratensis]|uniref:hypothetical protein n=1 Tax=Skermanella pratensis TaxID=2233999 RepID=UPI001300D6CB|nr:hypothetical protein [Skermanella pratensis]